jgi:hypothetical protein
MTVTAIPLLPCRTLEEVVPFYEALGFVVVQRQARPNAYAALRFRDVDVHFFGVASHDPARAYGMCLLIVPEVEALHASFMAHMQRHLGKVPSKGAPRLTRMRPGQSRFTVVDPSGNSIIYIRRGEADPHEETKKKLGRLSALGKALRAAEVLRDFKNDDEAAAKVIEVALAKAADADPAEREQAHTFLAAIRDETSAK